MIDVKKETRFTGWPSSHFDYPFNANQHWCAGHVRSIRWKDWI